MKKIVIYGLGSNYELFQKYARNRDFEIVALIDKNKMGELIEGFTVKSIVDLKNCQFEEIYVTIDNGRYEAIQNITEILGETVVIRDVDYLNQKYILSRLEDYQYVCIGVERDYIKESFKSITEMSNVLYTAIMSSTKFGNWEDEGSNKKERFNIVYLSQVYLQVKRGILEGLRKEYPNAKHCMYLGDMCDGEYGYTYFYDKNFVCNIKKEFDYCVSYHFKESEKYGFYHYDYPYSAPNSFDNDKEYDLFFVGRSKNRLPELYDIIDKAKENGVTYKFWIPDVSEDQKREDDGIIYDKVLNYNQYINEMRYAGCIVDICQAGDETTLRYNEAILYGKKLLTNDKSCKRKPCYNPEMIQYYSKTDDIDFDWIKKTIDIKSQYNGELGPEGFIEFIDKL